MKPPIPFEALDDRLGFVGTSGSGKTYTVLGRVELLLDRKARVCLIDPLGVAWGLRLSRDGKSRGFDIPIFGGPHGDLPLTEHSGALIGDTVAGMAESCIVDLSEIGSKAGERRFMLAFLTALYRNATKDPLHIIIDEADMFAPQRLLDKDGDAAKLLGMMETVVRRGRVKGFIPWLVTQRPASISKDVLSQVDGLVAMKLTASQDIDAISAWVESSADAGAWKQTRAALPAMMIGQGVVWIPGRGVLETVQFPLNATFDSSRAPKRGERKTAAAKLQPLDLGRLKERLGTVEAETKANDPRALRAEVARLSKLLDAKPIAAVDPAAVEAATLAGYKKGHDAARYEAQLSFAAVRDRVREMTEAIDDEMNLLPVKVSTEAARHVAARPAAPVARGRSDDQAAIPVGERTILEAIACKSNGLPRASLTVMTGYKKSSRDSYIQRLVAKGWAIVADGRVQITNAGHAQGPFNPPLTGVALQDKVTRDLPQGEGFILRMAIECYPKAVNRDDITNALGYKKSSRDSYIQRLCARELVTVSREGITASADLF